MAFKIIWTAKAQKDRSVINANFGFITDTISPVLNNGRTQREFLRLLVAEKGLTLNLNPPDNNSVYERYMKGTVESYVDTLKELIFELIDTNKK